LQTIEVVTGKERRRRWSDEEKLRLVAESYEPGSTVAQVARRREVAESCLYTWRKRFAEMAAAAERPLMIPVTVAEDTTASVTTATSARAATEVAPHAMASAPAARAVITLTDGTRLEIDAGYPPAALSALLGALRRR
jgi:transposase